MIETFKATTTTVAHVIRDLVGILLLACAIVLGAAPCLLSIGAVIAVAILAIAVCLVVLVVGGAIAALFVLAAYACASPATKKQIV